ncbi:hypothetical protein O3P69_002927 [Scylla paramamosain]|uniref:Uncharacterized protein n=1 Tax=Scylla paramamosain TaxID=85552 RepID=A0AAW0UM13_SCYPA
MHESATIRKSNRSLSFDVEREQRDLIKYAGRLGVAFTRPHASFRTSPTTSLQFEAITTTDWSSTTSFNDVNYRWLLISTTHAAPPDVVEGAPINAIEGHQSYHSQDERTASTIPEIMVIIEARRRETYTEAHDCWCVRSSRNGVEKDHEQAKNTNIYSAIRALAAGMADFRPEHREEASILVLPAPPRQFYNPRPE